MKRTNDSALCPNFSENPLRSIVIFSTLLDGNDELALFATYRNATNLVGAIPMPYHR